MRLPACVISIGVAVILLLGASAARAQEPGGVTSPSPPPSQPQQSASKNLPTAAAYSRPDAGQQWRNFARETFSPFTALKVLAFAGIGQAQNAPPEWGQGMAGYGDRVGSAFGRTLADTSSRYLIAAALRQDTSHSKCECSGFGKRLGYAVLSSFTARAGDDGHRVFSPAPIAAPYVGGFTQLAWYPDRFGAKDAVRWGSYGFLWGVGGNIAREFIPAKF